MYNPQVLLVPSNERENPHGMEDNACALENIFLAAHSFGIGSVWINQLRDICEEEEVRDILTDLGGFLKIIRFLVWQPLAMAKQNRNKR